MRYTEEFDDEEDGFIPVDGDEEDEEALEELTTDEDGHIGTHRGRTREEEYEPDFDEEFVDECFDDEDE
jgi:hypothetical protein